VTTFAASPQSYSNAEDLETHQNAPLPTSEANGALGTHGGDYSRAFAIMTRNGAFGEG
jgi:hypothetical protein